MDKSQSEVTDKIRNAIKEKLKEINAFVDDELPDYIMILVANKRSKHHMEKDLALFLGNETTDFTNWLWDLVNNLKVGTKSKRSKQDESESKISEAFPESKENRAEEDDVLNYDPAEEGEFYCIEDTNEPATNQLMEVNQMNSNASKIIPVSDSKIPVATLGTPVATPGTPVATPGTPVVTPGTETTVVSHSIAIKEIADSKDAAKKPEDKKLMELLSAIKNPASTTKTVQKSAKVYPVQRVKEVCSPVNELSVKPNTKFECDSIKPEHTANVSSVVCVTKRKYGGPAALQANKLLLRAVNDAAKSVLDGKDINEYYKPVPVKVLPTNTVETFDVNKNKNLCAKVKSVMNFETEKDLKIMKSNDNFETSTEVNACEKNEMETESLSSRQVINCKTDPLLDEMSEDSGSNSPNILHSTLLSEHDKQLAAPHFIVTLDGVNFSSLKRRRSSAEPMEIDDDVSMDESLDSTSTKKQKLQERCKYWPACKHSNNCAYHHPTVPCKCFPNCKFGDKCLYIHPNCKFDSLCSRKDCPYTHCSKRIFPIPPPVKPVKVQNTKMVCKYYPKCTAKSCRFIHPKLCRFGVQCRAVKCPFSHFQIPNRNQLKWKSQ